MTAPHILTAAGITAGFTPEGGTLYPLLARLENQRSMLTASIDSLNMLTNGKSEG